MTSLLLRVAGSLRHGPAIVTQASVSVARLSARSTEAAEASRRGGVISVLRHERMLRLSIKACLLGKRSAIARITTIVLQVLLVIQLAQHTKIDKPG